MPTLHCDSQSAIMLAKNLVFHAKTKHIDVKYHFIRDMLEDKILQLVNVHIDDNPTDLMTKGLSPERFMHCHALMGVGQISVLYSLFVCTSCIVAPRLKAHCPLSGRLLGR